MFEGLKLLNGCEFWYQILALIYLVYSSALASTRSHIGVLLSVLSKLYKRFLYLSFGAFCGCIWRTQTFERLEFWVLNFCVYLLSVFGWSQWNLFGDLYMYIWFPQVHKNGFHTLFCVLVGFWQRIRIRVTVTFEWLGVYTPNFDVYLLGIFGCSPLHSYGLLVYLWILFWTIWWETTLVGYTFLPVHIIS